MLLITLANVFVVQIQIRLLCDGYAGMSQEAAQCVDVHAIHQTSLGEVIPQTMRCVFLVQTSPENVSFEISFKVTNTDGTAMFLDREEVVALYVPILEL